MLLFFVFAWTFLWKYIWVNVILPNRNSAYFDRIPLYWTGLLEVFHLDAILIWNPDVVLLIAHPLPKEIQNHQWPKLFTKMGRCCEDKAIRMINMKLSCCPIKFVDLMTASNNSLHKIIIYMSISDIYPILNQVRLDTSLSLEPHRMGWFSHL